MSEEELKEKYISKEELKKFIIDRMKYLFVDSSGVDAGKYEAYRSIINQFQLED